MVTRLRHATVLIPILLLSACGERGESAADEMQRLQVEALAEAQRAEALRVKHESLVREYSRSAGRQIMDAIGGGQDLIVQTGEWYFDAPAKQLEIPMDVSFNGMVFRSNNYRVSGVLTVNENGSDPQFARLDANENYQNMESTLTALAVTAAGVMILADMGQDTIR